MNLLTTSRHVDPGTVRCHRYHGPTRQLDLGDIESYDIVLSTYGTVAADLAKNRGLLSRVHWYRIVLDEGKTIRIPGFQQRPVADHITSAHAIRNWSTKQFHAIHQLSAHSRWCMTGTPIQNSLEDLGALIRFIRLPILEDPTKFRRHIIGGIKIAGRLVGANFDNLKVLLSSICIRRPNSLLSLPGIKYEECRPILTIEERRQYNIILEECHQAIEKAVYNIQSQASGHSILESLLRLRLFCNGVTADLRDGQEMLSPQDKILSILQQKEDACCAYCHCEILSMDPVREGDFPNATPLVTCCRRLICADSSCAARYTSEASKTSGCPLCQSTDNQSKLTDMVPPPTPTMTSIGLPSKIAAFLQNVRKCQGSEKWFVIRLTIFLHTY